MKYLNNCNIKCPKILDETRYKICNNIRFKYARDRRETKLENVKLLLYIQQASFITGIPFSYQSHSANLKQIFETFYSHKIHSSLL